MSKIQPITSEEEFSSEEISSMDIEGKNNTDTKNKNIELSALDNGNIENNVLENNNDNSRSGESKVNNEENKDFESQITKSNVEMVLDSTDKVSNHDEYQLEFTDKEKKTMTYYVTQKMSDYPTVVCLLMFFLILLVIIAAVAGQLIALSDETQYDWIIPNSRESENLDALSDAIDQVDPITATTGSRSQQYDNSFIIIYENNDDKDLYNAKNLQSMCKVESLIVNNDEYDKICKLDSNNNCQLPDSSVVKYFYDYNNISDWRCNRLDDAAVDSKKQVIYDSMATLSGQKEYGIWLDKDSVRNGYTTKAQSIWYFGAPLDGYSSTTSKEQEQSDEYQDFLCDTSGGVDGVEKDFFDYFDIATNADQLFPYYPSPYMSTADTGDVGVMWYHVLITNNETARVVTSDLLFAIFSILFVLFWIRVHSGSTFIALMGMYMIFCSIPFSIFLYRGIFQIPYYTQLHTLVLFIILGECVVVIIVALALIIFNVGIGADDIFVLVDSWKQTKDLLPETLLPGEPSPEEVRLRTHHRLYLCYSHTMATVFNTSFTTGMAFVGTAFSPLMPISTFGIFAATCILVNYVFVITLMPPVVVLDEMYFSEYFCGLFGAKYAQVDSVASDGSNKHERTVEKMDIEFQNASSSAVVEADDEHELGAEATAKVDQNLSSNDNNINTAATTQDCNKDDAEENNDSEPNLFAKYYIQMIEFSVELPENVSNLIRIKSIPIVALFLSCGLLAFGVVGVTFGLQLVPPTSQEEWFAPQHMFTLALDSLSDDFLSFDDNLYETVTLTFGINGIDRSGFDIYEPGENRGSAKFSNKYDLSSEQCQKAFVKMCGDIESAKCDSDACKPSGLLARYNETECFMTSFRSWTDSNFGVDTYNLNSTYFYQLLDDYRQVGVQTHHDGETWEDEIGFIDGELKFASMYFLSTMEKESPMVDKLEVSDSIKDFMRKVKNYDECRNGCDCDSLMFTGTGEFVWMRSEIGIVAGFYQGMMIAFPVAFLVLLFATGNIIISIMAILSVFFITFGVLGFVNYALNWYLGVAESIAGIIIIGFSVDYTVHLGHMFTEAESEAGLISRKEKFEFAARKIGSTVIGGAITTLGAGVVLFACQLTFFTKMAVLITGTIMLSLLYSLGFFMSALYLIGPEGNTGNILYYFNSVWNLTRSYIYK